MWYCGVVAAVQFHSLCLSWDELRPILEARLASILESKVLTEVIPARVPATITTINYEPTDPSSPLSSPTFSFEDPCSGHVDDENELEKNRILTQIQEDLDEVTMRYGAHKGEEDEDEDDEEDDDEEDQEDEGNDKEDEDKNKKRKRSDGEHQDKPEGTEADKEHQESVSSPSASASSPPSTAPATESPADSTEADTKPDAAAEHDQQDKEKEAEETAVSSSSSVATKQEQEEQQQEQQQEQQHEDSTTTTTSTTAAEALSPAPTVESQPRLASRDLPAYETPDAYHQRICGLLSAFTSPPFTIQRICELLLDPTAHHTLVTKYLRAVEKVLNITSSIDEFSNPAYVGVSALDSKEGGEQGESSANGGYGMMTQDEELGGVEASMPRTTGSPEESRTVPTMAQDNKMGTSERADGGAHATAVPAATVGEEGDTGMDVDPPVGGLDGGEPAASVSISAQGNDADSMEVDS
ncbi:hypothetical protein BGZ73_000296 [Actinomortierella ambigua]|nr:hypothetical protein BGZ73_000296 [Actinomortierella ambigua]